jgi:hypothetical protein
MVKKKLKSNHLSEFLLLIYVLSFPKGIEECGKKKLSESNSK